MRVQIALRRLHLPALRLVTLACFFQFAGVQNGCTLAKMAGSAMGPVQPERSLEAVSDLFGGSASIPFWTLGPVQDKCLDLAASPVLLNLPNALRLARFLANPVQDFKSGIPGITPKGEGGGFSLNNPLVAYHQAEKYMIWKQEFWEKTGAQPSSFGEASLIGIMKAECFRGSCARPSGFSQALRGIRSVRRLHFDSGEDASQFRDFLKIDPSAPNKIRGVLFLVLAGENRGCAQVKLFLEIFYLNIDIALFPVDKSEAIHIFNTFALQKIYKMLSTNHETI